MTRRAPEVSGGRRRLLVGGFAAGPVLYAASTRSALALECRSPSQIFSGNLSQPGPLTCTAGKSPDVWKQNFNSWVGVDPPTIQRSSGGAWSDTGTGAEAQADFSAGGSALPVARIKITSGTYCQGQPVSNWDFGASFASVFGPGSDSGLAPVVPTMRKHGNINTCSGALYYPLDDRPVSIWEVLAYPTLISSTSVYGIGLGRLASYVAAAYLNKRLDSNYPPTIEQILHMWNEGRTVAGFCPTSGCSASSVWFAPRIAQYLTATWTL